MQTPFKHCVIAVDTDDNVCAAGSWALSRIARGDLEPGFMIKDVQKDLRLVRESLAKGDVDFAACALADQKFNEAVKSINADGERKGTQAMSVAYSSEGKL